MTAGSYDPHRTTAGGLAAEVDRLDRQAALSFDEELRILRALGIDESGCLLELGAGSGAVTRRLHAALPHATILALDIDPALLAHGDAAALRVVADGARLPLADDSVDTVLLRYVLQHLADPAALLAEVRRVLRPGGAVVTVEVDGACWGIAEPTYPEIAPIQGRAAQAQRAAGGERQIGRQLTRLLRAAGFDDVRLDLFATTSDERPIDDFEPHLGPQRLAPLVAQGALSLGDIAVISDRWRRFRADPDAWVMLIGFVGSGRAGAAGQ